MVIWLALRWALALGAVFPCLEMYCPSTLRGDGNCDPSCLNPMCSFDSSEGSFDCQSICPCAESELADAVCTEACALPECRWDNGSCGYCSLGCLLDQLGDGVCDSQCDTDLCYHDWGDCVTTEKPVEVYVSAVSGGSSIGSKESPYASLYTALAQAWAPYTIIHLLKGKHSLAPPDIPSESTDLPLHSNSISIQTLFCQNDTSDHPECADENAEIVLTKFGASVQVSARLHLRDIAVVGGFFLEAGCFVPSCTYCPAVHFNLTTNSMNDDRNQPIDDNQYADQILCDAYAEFALFHLSQNSVMNLTNVVFRDIRHQPKAVILSQCGHLNLTNVTFSNVMPARLGLSGGVIQQAPQNDNAPYNCGSFAYQAGLVELLNNGYEYSENSYFSGFLWLVGVNTISISQVEFSYNNMLIGKAQQAYGSALIHLQQFRQLVMVGNTFKYNLADTGSALYINSALDIPLVVSHGVAVDNAILHVRIEDNYFANNTGRKGSVIYIRFLRDHQNVLARNNTFINNFATEGGIFDLEFGYLAGRFTVGENLTILNDDNTTEHVFVPPIKITFSDLRLISNYGTTISYLTYIPNFLATDCLFIDNGDSSLGLSFASMVLTAYMMNPRTYTSAVPTSVQPPTCIQTIRVHNSYNVTLQQLTFRANLCSQGSPGFTLSGSTQFVTSKQIGLSKLTFQDNLGFGMVALTTSQDLSFDEFVYTNNTNSLNEYSVCLDITQTTPTVITLNDSVFRGNRAMYSTVARVSGAKGFILNNISAIDNIASSTSAGLQFTPLITSDSFISVTGSSFESNSALRSGVILVSETTGNMLYTSARVTITLRNNTFRDNRTQYGGCCLTISGFISLSSNSVIQNNSFVRNECPEGGSAAYLTFVSGIMKISNCRFEENTGNYGSAIYTTHQGLQSNSYLSVSECVFVKNVGRSTIHMAGAGKPLLLTSANVFLSNNGSALYIAQGRLQEHDSSFSENISPEGTVLMANDYSEISLKNIVCVSNSASIKGGVASVTVHTFVVCLHCNFSSNSCDKTGGVVSIDQESIFNCSDCHFLSNTVGMKGAAIYSIFSYIALAYSTLLDNRAAQFASVVLIESSMDMSGVEMARNTAAMRSPGVVMSMSTFTARNCSSWNQSGETGAFLYAFTLNTIAIADSSFYLATATAGAVFSVSINSTLEVTRSQFRECQATNDGSLLQLREASAVMRQLTITGLVAPSASSAFSISQAQLTLDSSTVSKQQGSVIAAQSSSVVITNSQVQNVEATFGAVLNCMSCLSVIISNSIMRDNVAKQGGVVYSYSTGFLSDALSSVFTDNRFEGNKAVNGGAIFSNSVPIEMRGNIFTRNSASGENYESSGLLKQGYGGAAFVVCEFLIFCKFVIHSNTFEMNTAQQRGGAIYWFDSYPQISSNMMNNNSAVYGADIASFAIRLAPVASNLQLGSYQTNGTVPLILTLQHVASGHLSDELITLALVDHYESIVCDDSDSSASIAAVGNITVTGNTQVVATKGIFKFSGLVFKGEPESQQTLQVSTSGIDPILKEYTQDPSAYIPTVAVALSFRACLMGESLQNVECYLCPEGTFSLKPSEPCNSCPSHVTCHGNYTMTPDPGYWRPDVTLDLFFPCPNPDACLGSPESLAKISLTGACAEGYEGNLCSSCVLGFSQQGKNKCSKCPSFTANVVVSTLIAIAALSFGGVVVAIAIRGASRPRSELAIHVKIFMNYLQMIVVAASLNLNWPDFVAIFLSGQDTAGSFTEQLFSVDCILQRFESKDVFYSKLRSTAMMPAGLLLFAFCVWMLISLCSKVTQLVHKLVATLVMIIFILHSSLSKITFSLFACRELKPGELWLMSELSLRCWNSEHVRNILYVSIPSISVWIFGLPMSCLLLLYRFRRRLADPLTQLKYSFLYKGYHAKWYFWEFVILYRKVALICASVFLSTVSIMVQALSVLAVLLISLFFQLQVEPFILSIFNQLELKSIMVSSVTIYAGLFYQTESISLEVKILLFVMILAANSYFLLWWLRCILPLVIETIRRRFAYFAKRYNVKPAQSKHRSTMDFFNSADMSGTSKVTREVVHELGESSLSQSRVTPISDVPQNSPDHLDVEYSVEQDESRLPS